MLDLPAGTKLVARLQSVVNSAIRMPVVAAIEYNYEKDGQIVVPAGAKASEPFNKPTAQDTWRSGSTRSKCQTEPRKRLTPQQ